ncbi:MAG: ATP-dependent Clp protease ATP-binding subunit [Candidatus Obscuribacter sp.]|nr:ATP-dependent Clp protease ATP-binding subunit [Candidatus Melainabacteria bacterium]MDX1989097.1 ATP-dependent Clp protease ATP-binding subunit [Candidatus Obscuribacter sp.]
MPLQTAIHAAETERDLLGRPCIDGNTLTLGIWQEATSRTAKLLVSSGLNIAQLRELTRKSARPNKTYNFKMGAIDAQMSEALVQAIQALASAPVPQDKVESHAARPSSISSEDLYRVLLTKDKILRQSLLGAGLTEKSLNQLEASLAASHHDAEADQSGAGKPGKSSALKSFCTDLVTQAQEGKLSPVIGRLTEISKTIRVLGRKTKSNPVLLGEAGVGKTAIVEGIAQRIATGNVPSKLKGKRILQLDLTAMLAGCQARGDFEARLVKLIKEVKAAGNVILFIDEMHTLVGAGAAAGGLDAANSLKPELVRGEISVIGATTLSEYRKGVENRDAALMRRFRPVLVEPPDINDTVQILQGLKAGLEKHHDLEICDQALVLAAHLSDRYVADRFQPDKSIDLVDEACSMVAIAHDQEKMDAVAGGGNGTDKQKRKRKLISLKQTEEKPKENKVETEPEKEEEPVVRPLVTTDHITQVVSMMTGIPVAALDVEETSRLLTMEEHLHKRVIGQNEAISAVSRAVRRGRAGIKDPRRPTGMFLFLGPTGVGKTELAKALQAFLSNNHDLIRLDMSEFMERHSAAKLIGAPPGYVGYEEGGKLTEAVRRRPYGVILLDEIEKAHPDVFNLLLQISDAGRLTDGQARTVDFKNSIIIMTSNIGARAIQQALRSKSRAPTEEIMQEVRQVFSPELINRMDEIICFHPLSRPEQEEILQLIIGEIKDRLPPGLSLELTEEARDILIAQGYDSLYGARPLRRTVTRKLEDPLADLIIAGKPASGDTLMVETDDDLNLTVRIKQEQSKTVVLVKEEPAD